MRKIICDKCKKIIYPIDEPRVLNNKRDYTDFDLCKNCYEEFKKWIKNETEDLENKE